MSAELELHAYEIERLQSTPRERVFNRVLRVLIQSYRSGELSADDLRRYTNINPDDIDLIDLGGEDHDNR